MVACQEEPGGVVGALRRLVLPVELNKNLFNLTGKKNPRCVTRTRGGLSIPRRGLIARKKGGNYKDRLYAVVWFLAVSFYQF